jgi:hypothetical protein
MSWMKEVLTLRVRASGREGFCLEDGFALSKESNHYVDLIEANNIINPSDIWHRVESDPQLL